MKTYEELKMGLSEYYSRIINDCYKKKDKNPDLTKSYQEIINTYEMYKENIEEVTKMEIAQNVKSLIDGIRNAYLPGSQYTNNLPEFIEKFGGIDRTGNELRGMYYFQQPMIFFGMSQQDLQQIIPNIHSIRTDETYDQISQKFNEQYGTDIPTRKELKEAEEKSRLDEASLSNYLDLLRRDGSKEHGFSNQKQISNTAVEQQASSLVERMANGEDVLGEGELENTNNRQLGFTAPWLLGLVTGIIICGLVILGAIFLR